MSCFFGSFHEFTRCICSENAIFFIFWNCLLVKNWEFSLKHFFWNYRKSQYRHLEYLDVFWMQSPVCVETRRKTSCQKHLLSVTLIVTLPISLTSALSKVAETWQFRDWPCPETCGTINHRSMPVRIYSRILPRWQWLPCCIIGYLPPMAHHLLYKNCWIRLSFDLVDHHILIAKLFSIGVKATMVNWIIDFLRHRQHINIILRVKYRDIFFDWFDVHAGVPHGTRLGAWLLLVNYGN